MNGSEMKTVFRGGDVVKVVTKCDNKKNKADILFTEEIHKEDECQNNALFFIYLFFYPEM